MFVFNLQPFPLRGDHRSDAWLARAAGAGFRKSRLAFIGSDWQFKALDEGAVPAPEAVEALGVPLAGAAGATRIVFPHQEVREILDRFPSHLHLAAAAMGEGLQKWREFLYRELSALQRAEPVEAVVQWGEDRAMADVGRYLGIPVVRLAPGPFEAPDFRVRTFLFDRRGLGRDSEASARWERFSAEARASRLLAALPSRRALLERWLDPALKAEVDRRRAAEPAFEFGAALPADDEAVAARALAGFGGEGPLEFLHRLRLIYPAARISLRHDPRGRLQLARAEGLAEIDRTESALLWLSTLKRFACVDSPLAAPALLLGLPTFVLGDAPAAFLAHRALDRHVWEQFAEDPAIEEKTRFFCVNCLVPGRAFMDEDYVRWRLSNPTEAEIAARHLEMHEASLAEEEAIAEAETLEPGPLTPVEEEPEDEPMPEFRPLPSAADARALQAPAAQGDAIAAAAARQTAPAAGDPAVLAADAAASIDETGEFQAEETAGAAAAELPDEDAEADDRFFDELLAREAEGAGFETSWEEWRRSRRAAEAMPPAAIDAAKARSGPRPAAP